MPEIGEFIGNQSPPFKFPGRIVNRACFRIVGSAPELSRMEVLFQRHHLTHLHDVDDCTVARTRFAPASGSNNPVSNLRKLDDVFDPSVTAKFAIYQSTPLSLGTWCIAKVVFDHVGIKSGLSGEQNAK